MSEMSAERLHELELIAGDRWDGGFRHEYGLELIEEVKRLRALLVDVAYCQLIARDPSFDELRDGIEHAVAVAEAIQEEVKAEREACAKIVDAYTEALVFDGSMFGAVAELIRARGAL